LDLLVEAKYPVIFQAKILLPLMLMKPIVKRRKLRILTDKLLTKIRREKRMTPSIACITEK
jgi:hypothetical protein